MTQPLNAMIIRPRISEDDPEWLIEVSNAEVAIDRLLDAKRQTVAENPQRETVSHPHALAWFVATAKLFAPGSAVDAG